MKRVLTFVVLVGLLASTAQADFILKLTDVGSATTVTIPDADPLDSSALAGVIIYNGAVGASTWQVNVTTGISKPVLGGVPTPHMDLNSVNVSSAGAGQLLIELTDTDFALPVDGAEAALLSEIGGTTAGTVLFNQYLDRGNNEFGYLDYVVAQGPFGPGAFSGTDSVATPVVDGVPFSVSEWVLITHTGNGVTSFDAESTVVPVPGAVLLGMLGLGAAGLKLRRRV